MAAENHGETVNPMTQLPAPVRRCLVLAPLRRCLAVALLPVLAASAWAMAGWTDRNEYDLVLKIRVEASPQKQLELLNQWKQKYPQSEMRQVRRELFLAAYQASGDVVHMFETAREMLGEEPNNFVGVYWSALLLPEIKDNKPETLDVGEKAARQLQAGLDTYFAPSQKPEGVADADWQKQKSAAGLLALRAIGWVAWQRGDFAAAESSFTAYLNQEPKSAELASWLGYVLAYQNKAIPAAWQLARASSMHDEGALPEVWRRQVDELVDRLYTTYHGDSDGLDKLKTASAASPFPPADFQVESADAIKQRKAEEALTQADPELAAWLRIFKQLSGPDAEKYFLESMKPSPLPMLRGTVIRCTPAGKPSEVLLGLTSATAEEVVLKVSAPFANSAEPGTQIHFQGTADTFTKDPFRLTVLADRANVTGWPEAAPPRKRK
jgi:hypothetical protein